MNADQRLVRLGPRIKLLKRHLREWKDLLIQQKQVRGLANETRNQQPISDNDNKMAVHTQITTAAYDQSRLIINQTIERNEMKARHKQEETELEQAITTHK